MSQASYLPLAVIGKNADTIHEYVFLNGEHGLKIML